MHADVAEQDAEARQDLNNSATATAAFKADAATAVAMPVIVPMKGNDIPQEKQIAPQKGTPEVAVIVVAVRPEP
jgi:hypothetical protein